MQNQISAKEQFKSAYQAVRKAGRGASMHGHNAIGEQFSGLVMEGGELFRWCEVDEVPHGAKPFKGFVFGPGFLELVPRMAKRHAAMQAFAARLWDAEKVQKSPVERLCESEYIYY